MALPLPQQHKQQDQLSAPLGFPTPSDAPGRLTGQKSSRACEGCRGLKVRCLPDDSSPSAQCRRCAKFNRECIFTAPSMTRRRKRTDTRVGELEKEVRALSTLLKREGGSNPVGIDEDEIEDDESRNLPTDRGRGGGTLANESPSIAICGFGRQRVENMTFAERSLGEYEQNSIPTSASSYDKSSGRGTPRQSAPNSDVVDRGLLSLETAAQLFDRYVNELVQYHPTVVFPEGCTADEIRRTKPALFLAVIAAAAGTSDPDLNRSLNKEISQLYAERIIMNGEKSLELVQSLLITLMWYYPPDNFEDLKFYQYIHIAATMSLDIGIGKKPRIGTSREYTSVSMSLRQPNMMRFTSWMAECVECLENSSEAAPTDKRLAAWVKLQRIMEETVTSFALDDPDATVSLVDPRVQLRLKGFEKQLEEWKKNIDPHVMNASLDINFHVNNVYLHEIALHLEHNREDFRPPFLVERISRLPKSQSDLSPPCVDAILTCLFSAHSLLDTFLDMDVETLRAIPVIILVRMMYCVVILIKLFMSASATTSGIGRVLERESLKVTHYMDNLSIHLMMAAEDGRSRAASKFLIILTKLKSWFQRQTTQPYSENSQEDVMEPLVHLSIQHNQEESLPLLSQPAKAGDYAVGTLLQAPTRQATTNMWTEKQNELATQLPQRGPPLHSNDFSDSASAAQNETPPLAFESESALPLMSNDLTNYSMDIDPYLFSHLNDPGMTFENLDSWMLDDGMLGGMEYEHTSGSFDWAPESRT